MTKKAILARIRLEKIGKIQISFIETTSLHVTHMVSTIDSSFLCTWAWRLENRLRFHFLLELSVRAETYFSYNFYVYNLDNMFYLHLLCMRIYRAAMNVEWQ